MRRVHGSSIADGCSSASHTSNVKCIYVGEEEVPLPLPVDDEGPVVIYPSGGRGDHARLGPYCHGR
jgi:hypothetical protein